MENSERELTPEEQEKLKLNVMKATAVRQAMFEIIGEQREQIIKRARAKLIAMGVQFTEEDINAQIP